MCYFQPRKISIMFKYQLNLLSYNHLQSSQHSIFVMDFLLTALHAFLLSLSVTRLLCSLWIKNVIYYITNGALYWSRAYWIIILVHKSFFCWHKWWSLSTIYSSKIDSFIIIMAIISQRRENKLVGRKWEEEEGGKSLMVLISTTWLSAKTKEKWRGKQKKGWKFVQRSV